MSSDSVGNRVTATRAFENRTNGNSRDADKTKEQLIDEVTRLRQRLAEQESAEVEFNKTEKPPKALEGTFRTFIEYLPNTVVYMASLDERSTTFYVSAQVEQVLGYSQMEYENDPDIWAKNIHPDDYERVMADVAQCHETGEKFVSEYRMIRKDGEVIWLHDEANIVRDRHGDPLYLLGVNTNITDRKHAEEALHGREAELQLQARCLDDASAAFKFLLDLREDDKAALERAIQSNVKELLLPYVEKLKNSRLDPRQEVLVKILESNITNIATSFVTKLSSSFVNLTPSEIKVANLIKEGRTSKEIAELLNLSENTILFHRHNIRSKLGLKNQKVNLSSHLRSIGS